VTRWTGPVFGLFLLNFEKELFVHVSTLEARASKGNEKALEKARSHIRDRLTQLAPVFLKNSTCWVETSLCWM